MFIITMLVKVCMSTCLVHLWNRCIYIHLHQSTIDMKDENDQKVAKFSTTELSISGDIILSYFACAIYCQTLLSSKIMLPLTISPLWILKKLMPIVVNRLPKYVLRSLNLIDYFR